MNCTTCNYTGEAYYETRDDYWCTTTTASPSCRYEDEPSPVAPPPTSAPPAPETSKQRPFRKILWR